MKLLQFHQDYRPPYWGTWSKTSKDVTGRRPLGRDSQGLLNYDCDSEGGFHLDTKSLILVETPGTMLLQRQLLFMMRRLSSSYMSREFPSKVLRVFTQRTSTI